MKKLDADGHFKDKKIKIPWYSPPIQRQRWNDDNMLPIVNYGTLFFDLFFVGAMYNLGEMILSAINNADTQNELRAIIYFVGIFGPIFVTWETDVYYQSRYCVVDYAHRLFEGVRFVFITAAVLFIRPMNELSDPQSSIAPMMLTLAISLESLMHLLLNVELYYKAQGDREAIQNHTMRKIKKQLIPTSMTYLASTLVAAVFYFAPIERTLNNGDVWNVTDLPLTLTALGYLSNICFTFIRKMRATRGTADIRKTFVPNNIDFLIQRYADWFLLLLGEVVRYKLENDGDYLSCCLSHLTTVQYLGNDNHGNYRIATQLFCSERRCRNNHCAPYAQV